MGKTIDSIVQTSLDSKNFSGVILAKLYFDTPQRYCSAYQSVFWDEPGVGGEQEYIGLGNLASMSVINETMDLSSQTIQLSLSGIPNNTITTIFSDEYIGKPLYIWYATLDPDTYAVEYDTNEDEGPILIFAGLMDYGTIEFGKTATITVNATNRLADWERPRGGRFNQVYQQRHVDATDNGFHFLQILQNKPLSWGSYTLDDGGNPGVGGGGSNGGDEHDGEREPGFRG